MPREHDEPIIKYKNNTDDWKVNVYFARISEIVIQLSASIIFHNLI